MSDTEDHVPTPEETTAADEAEKQHEGESQAAVDAGEGDPDQAASDAAAAHESELVERRTAYDDKQHEANELTAKASEATAEAKAANDEAAALGADLPVDPPSPASVFLAELARLKNVAGAVSRSLMIDHLAHAVVGLIDAIEAHHTATKPPADEG
jgi:hypothetical protein